MSTATAGSPYSIQVHALDKVFATAGGSTVRALDGVELDIRRGEFVTLLGPSGCGKTTLLRVIADLEKPSSGTVTFHRGGDGADHVAGEDEIGFVFQEPHLMDWRTVRGNVELPLEIRRVGREERREVSDRLLEMVGLSRFADAYPRQLSGGMRQRVAIARALSYNPAVLLMDEPFGALDAQTRDTMNLELQDLWMRHHKTSVFVTHSIPEAVFLGDRVVLMATEPGRIQTIVPVEFPRPRSVSLLADPAFTRLVGRLREELEAGSPAATPRNGGHADDGGR